MILQDNLLDSNLSIDYLIGWLEEEKKNGGKFIRLRVNDVSEEDTETTLDMIDAGNLTLEKLQLESDINAPD